jgi:outer membrane immunogenic protein
MKKTLLAFGILALLGTSSAIAADVVAPAPAFDWSGPYIGAFGAYGFGSSRMTDTAGTTTGDFNVGGMLGGLDLGYNVQKGNILWGAEVDGAISGDTGTTLPLCGTGCTTNLNWLSTARGRIGIAHDKALFYATGGLAVGGLTGNVGTTASGSGTNVGYTIGAGAELAITPNLSAKVQYLYVNLGTYGIPTPLPVTVRADNNHIVSVGLNYKF